MAANQTLESNQYKTVINLKKARSHLIRIEQMLSENCDYIELMQQNLAVIGLLKSAQKMLMEDYLHQCLKSTLTTKNNRNQIVEEILTVTKLLKR